MKLNSVFGKLGRFKHVHDAKRGHYFYSRQQPKGLDRMVRVIEQDGLAVCLPIFVEQDGTETVAFHAKTIKSLVDFLEAK